MGYWAWDVAPGEPYIQGSKDYLYRAIGWARNTGLKILVGDRLGGKTKDRS
jgi:glucan 1,3-beta-glucosidase